MAKRQYNGWRESKDGTIEIELTQGKVALIDKIDVGRVLKYKWCAHAERSGWYAYAGLTVAPNKAKILKMHRVIMSAPKGMDVDHINGDGLDNRRCNLRLATRAQNQANSDGRPSRKAKHKGTFLVTDRFLRKPWGARFRTRKLGYFATEEEAAHAYNEAAQECFGEFARLNDV